MENEMLGIRRLAGVALALCVWLALGCGDPDATAPPAGGAGSYACYARSTHCTQYDVEDPSAIQNLAFSCMLNDGYRWQAGACRVVGNIGRCVSARQVIVVYSLTEEYLSQVRSTCIRSGDTWLPP